MTKPYTVAEAADLLRCHKRTIVNHIREGKLTGCSFVAGRWLIPEASIRKLLDENGTREFKVNG